MAAPKLRALQVGAGPLLHDEPPIGRQLGDPELGKDVGDERRQLGRPLRIAGEEDLGRRSVGSQRCGPVNGDHRGTKVVFALQLIQG